MQYNYNVGHRVFEMIVETFYDKDIEIDIPNVVELYRPVLRNDLAQIGIPQTNQYYEVPELVEGENIEKQNLPSSSLHLVSENIVANVIQNSNAMALKSVLDEITHYLFQLKIYQDAKLMNELILAFKSQYTLQFGDYERYGVLLKGISYYYDDFDRRLKVANINLDITYGV